MASNPIIPPGIGAALLDKGPSERVTNHGQLPVVFANDVKLSATSNEVVMTFAVRGGDNAQTVTEVACVAMTWPGIEAVGRVITQLIGQGLGFRMENLQQQLAEITEQAERLQALQQQMTTQEG